ncbi:MAG: TIGR02186 family protein [Planktomarina sp.]
MIRYLAALFILLAPIAKAQEVVVGLSDEEVGIDTFFNGSELFVYGAIRPSVEILLGFDDPFEVVITIASPREPVIVRRKERRYGIWMNVDTVEVDAAPQFYAVATTKPFDELVTATDDLRYSISAAHMIRSVGAPMNIENAANFPAALQRINTEKGYYEVLDGAVDLKANTLFSTALKLPANITDGAYDLRVFILREGAVAATFETQIDVQKVGLERWLHSLAYNQPMIYGIMSVLIAIFAGWGASVAFGRLLRG